MKKYILIVVLIVVAIGVGATFLVLNLDSINHATVVATVVGEGGSMNDVGEKTYEKNTNPQYIISANSGYHIKSVVVDGNVLVSESEFKTNCSYIFEKIKGEHTIKVEFAQNLSVSLSQVGVNGTIEYENALANYAYAGQNVSFKIVPSTLNSVSEGRYPIKGIKINGQDYSIDGLLNASIASGFRLTRDANTGEYKLVVMNLQNSISIEVVFGYSVRFAYNKKVEEEPVFVTWDSFAVKDATTFAQSSYTTLLNTASESENIPEGKTTITGWAYKVWAANENVPEKTGTVGTNFNELKGVLLNNSTHKNITFTAIYA